MPGDEPVDFREPVADMPESIGTPELDGVLQHLNPATALIELQRDEVTAVTAVDDRPAALLVAGHSQPNVAVLDVRFPAMAGDELAQRSRSSRPLRSIEAA